MNAQRQTASSNTVNHLAARWEEADKTILRKIFPLLAEGRPVPLARIGEVSGRDREAIEAALKNGRAGRDQQDRVVELSGLQLSPTVHRIEIGQVALFACCALFSHVVPLLLKQEVKVESIDPVSRRVVRLNIAAQGVNQASPRKAMGALVVTEPDAVMRDAGKNFCRHVRHFASPESAAEFTQACPGRYAVSLGELHWAARKLYEVVWSDPTLELETRV